MVSKRKHKKALYAFKSTLHEGCHYFPPTFHHLMYYYFFLSHYKPYTYKSAVYDFNILWCSICSLHDNILLSSSSLFHLFPEVLLWSYWGAAVCILCSALTICPCSSFYVRTPSVVCLFENLCIHGSSSLCSIASVDTMEIWKRVPASIMCP